MSQASVTVGGTEPYGLVAVMRAMRAGTIPPTVTAADRAVLLVYADFAGEDGIAWPAQDKVRTAAGCSVDTVRRSLAVLTRANILQPMTAADLTNEARAKYERISPDRRPKVYRLNLTGLHHATSQAATPQVATSQIAATGVASCGDRGSKLLPKSLIDPLTESRRVPAPRGATPKRTSRLRSDQPPHPEHHETFAYWIETATKVYGRRPVTGGSQGGRIATSVKKLLTDCGTFDAAKQVIDRCVQDARRPDIHQIASTPDRWGPLASNRPSNKQAVPSSGTRTNLVEL